MYLNPFNSNIYFDSCAFDGGSGSEQSDSIKCRKILEDSGNKIQILHSVQKEIDFPNTPDRIKKEAMSLLGTIETGLEKQEIEVLRDIENIIVGNGNLEKRRADCRHVFETVRYGDYFITTDKGILNRSKEIKIKYHIFLIRPSQLLEIILKNKT